MATIGFIGLDNMGAPMAADRAKAGHSGMDFQALFPLSVMVTTDCSLVVRADTSKISIVNDGAS